MSAQKYIIIGREVGEASHHLVGNDVHPAEDNPGGTPLDVRFIGDLMTQMSEREDRVATEDEKKWLQHCLQPDSLPTGNLTETQKEKILANTTVEVAFETRTSGADITEDTNTRIMVVPADGTLKAALDDIVHPIPGAPFDPPLTYQPDKDMMLDWLSKDLFQRVLTMPEPNDAENMTWAEKMSKVTDYMQDVVDQETQKTNLTKLEAYLRAVGIYVTNMCR